MPPLLRQPDASIALRRAWQRIDGGASEAGIAVPIGMRRGEQFGCRSSELPKTCTLLDARVELGTLHTVAIRKMCTVP